MLYKARNEAIIFYDDYPLNNTTKETGLKKFTSKQMLQRLPIALVQVKACNNSENFLNEIRQIICSLYQ